MAGGNRIVAECKVLPEVALAHVVDIDSPGDAPLPRAVQPLGAHAAVHVLQHAGVRTQVLAVAKLAHMRELQQRHGQA